MGILLLGFAPEEVDQAVLDEVRSLVPDLRLIVTSDRAEIERLLGEVEVAAGHLPSDLLVRAPQLRWYQQWGAGADWLLRYPEAAERDFILTSASGVHAVPISEHIVGLLLMFARALHEAVRTQDRHEWARPPAASIFELAEKTMLLVGVGAIGERTALLASALGMRVEGIRHDPSRVAEGVAAMYGVDQLRERLPQADVVVLTIPLSPATRGMIGAEELRAMRPSAYLINIGRGGTVDEAALVEALQEERIAGAGLDVFAEEPLPRTSPLWTMQNVVITAHYAGSTPRYNERAMAIFLDNLRRYRAGTPLSNVVDKHEGY